MKAIMKLLNAAVRAMSRTERKRRRAERRMEAEALRKWKRYALRMKEEAVKDGYVRNMYLFNILFMIRVIIEPVYGNDGFEALKKSIRILGLKVYEKTVRPIVMREGESIRLPPAI
jgi:hypothetical protein